MCLEQITIPESNRLLPGVDFLDCLPAAMTNIFRPVRGIETVSVVKERFKGTLTKFQNLRAAQRLSRDLKMKIEIRAHSYKAKIQQDSGYFALQFIAELQDSCPEVCIVRLETKKNGQKGSDHSQVVDKYNRLILDVAEKELIILTPDNLRLSASEVGLTAGMEFQMAERMEAIGMVQVILFRKVHFFA